MIFKVIGALVVALTLSAGVVWALQNIRVRLKGRDNNEGDNT